jgi:hypothetical protein
MLYGRVQSRLCPNSLHLLNMSEKYATCNPLKAPSTSSMKLIQKRKKWTRNGKYRGTLFWQGVRVQMHSPLRRVLFSVTNPRRPVGICTYRKV